MHQNLNRSSPPGGRPWTEEVTRSGGLSVESPRVELPTALVEQFRPNAAATATDILREIQLRVPEYARPLEGPFGKTITQGVETAILHFIGRLENPQADRREKLPQFLALGKLEFSQGRSLDSLLSAYRIGARVAWHAIARKCEQAGVSSATVSQLAETMFAYIDEMSTLSVEGYASAQAQAAGVVQRRRERIVELLLSESRIPADRLAELAGAAGWTVPERLAVVAIEPLEDCRNRLVMAPDDSVLIDLEGPRPCIVTPEPERQLKWLRAELRGWRAAVGPLVPALESRGSWQLAKRALRAARRGQLDNDSVIVCNDHLATLWLLSDDLMTRTLVDQALAPLSTLKPKQQARLAETLLAWLESRGGGAVDVAERLGVHPQTVRYRLRQLEELFGDLLHDTDRCFDLEIALRALRVRGAVAAPSGG